MAGNTRGIKVHIPPIRDVRHLRVLGSIQNPVEFFARDMELAEQELREERGRVEEAALRGDKDVCSRAGFVTFTSRRWCRLASREQIMADATQFSVQMPPDPSDVVYKNLAQKRLFSFQSKLAAWGCYTAIFVAWMPVVVTISGMTTIASLQKYFPFLRRLIIEFPVVESVLEGVLSTVALNVFIALLPRMLMAIICQFLMLKSGALAQLSLQRVYFTFQVLFVVLVKAITHSLLTTIQAVLEHPRSAFLLLGSSLPSCSHFYLNFLVLGWLAMMIQLLRPSNLSRYIFFRQAFNEKEARKRSEPEDQASNGMGARMAKAALMLTVSLVFSTSCPIISIFAWVYFFAGKNTYAYLLLHAETKKPDLGGAFWVAALDHVTLAVCLYVALMIGMLARQQEATHPTLATAAVFVVVFLRWRRIKEFSWEYLPFDSIVKMDKQRALDDGPREVGRYMQPECVGETRSSKTPLEPESQTRGHA